MIDEDRSIIGNIVMDCYCAGSESTILSECDKWMCSSSLCFAMPLVADPHVDETSIIDVR